MLRGKSDIALECFAKACEGRLKFIDTKKSQYQLAILFLNLAFCYKNNEDFDTSNKLLIKSILILESLEKVSKESPFIDSLVE